MNRRHVQLMMTAALVALCGMFALAQQRQDDPNRQPPPPPRPAAPIPQDTRVPLPSDTRAPLGSNRLQGLPPASERGRQPDAGAGRRPDSPGGGGSTSNPGNTTSRPYPRRYPSYWVYERYWYDRPYYDRPYYDGPYERRRDWVDDTGPDDARRRDAAAPRDQGGKAVEPASRVPDLPPDELLGEEDLTAALKQALDASPEWRQATAELIRAWSAYADAVEAALRDLQDDANYRKAQAELQKAKARLETVQGSAPGRNARADPPVDRLLAATDAALKARRAVRKLESAALSADAGVQRAEKRLDAAVDRRNEIRDKLVARLPEKDRPAPAKKPKLLEDDQ